MAKSKSQLNPKNDSFFFSVPDFIFDDTRINAGAKLTWSAISRLAENNAGICTAKASYLAAKINVSVRSIHYYIQSLVHHNLLTIIWRGKKRLFVPLIMRIKDINEVRANQYILKHNIIIDFRPMNNGKALITTDIIKKGMTPILTLVQGTIEARSTNNPHGGYLYEDMDQFAQYIGRSVSSAYRYISRLKKHATIKVDGYRFKSTSKWIIKHNVLNAKALNKSVKTQEIENSPVMNKPPLDAETESALDSLFRKM